VNGRRNTLSVFFNGKQMADDPLSTASGAADDDVVLPVVGLVFTACVSVYLVGVMARRLWHKHCSHAAALATAQATIVWTQNCSLSLPSCGASFSPTTLPCSPVLRPV
jgi:hypothetical protein